jgi:glycosyltransferase involved in cell wall biosynthesis
MKILTVHNTYQQRGGEDTVLAAETPLLESHGHVVIHYGRDNDEIEGKNGIGALAAAAETVWSFSSRTALRKILKTERPDVALFHNTFPLVSPSAYYACADAGVPVVQTLHNYRLLCPGSTFLRDGKVCELCLGRAMPWPSVLHGCYRESRPATLATAAMLSVHHALGTWRNKVGLYIALTEFARKKFIEGGLPAERIVVKPCFVNPDPGPRTGSGDTVLFLGRLSPEKGLRSLITAWEHLGGGAPLRIGGNVPLRIAGDGPLREELEAEVERRGIAGIKVLGRVPHTDISAEMKRARFLVFPSEWYEGLPLTITEAFACGVPVVASRIGSMIELVEDGRTGLHFNPNDPADMAAKVEWAWSHPKEMEEMGRAARREYETKYTPEINYMRLMEICERAIGNGNGKTETLAAAAGARGD